MAMRVALVRLPGLDWALGVPLLPPMRQLAVVNELTVRTDCYSLKHLLLYLYLIFLLTVRGAS